MYVGVVHTIRDADGWMEMMRGVDPAAMPAGIELLSTGTSQDVDRAVCLWRAPSVEALQTALDQLAGPYAHNDCFGVQDETVMVAGPVQQAAGV
ncbi:hypothetical protein LY71_104180 [Geodermatophilus tzadiensis]|uniref:Uncharacterized protein n=1 Tax=Geodermatophilus tzadiensis TaxID=1137988 RepID=A0A2T0TWW5_9ACTN|nr:hypothetical protein [Geodermatophilus tzadiensis]PRY50143.1 hypothetical protein LY71_104180 [Geodermatophilus tzadiensis]